MALYKCIIIIIIIIIVVVVVVVVVTMYDFHRDYSRDGNCKVGLLGSRGGEFLRGPGLSSS